MSRNLPPQDDIDAALSRLPEWQPPPGFAGRVASLATGRPRLLQPGVLPMLGRALALAACVSVGACVAGELLYVELLSMGAPEGSDMTWMLAVGALVLAANGIRRSLGSRA